MGITYTEMPKRQIGMEYTPTAAECDCCGKSAWYPAHKRPNAILSRVRDDLNSNMDIWDLDLCVGCTDVVMQALHLRASLMGRTLPNTREEIFNRATSKED